MACGKEKQNRKADTKNMSDKVLEVNVDDLYLGGVFSLVKNVVKNKPKDMQIDIAAIEKFTDKENIQSFEKCGSKVYYVGYDGNKWLKQFICFFHLKKLIREQNYTCVHIHADVANKLMVSGMAARTAGVTKIILHSHAAGVDGNHRWLKAWIHRRCRRLLKWIGTDYVACSDIAAEWMFPNIAAKEITLIQNGIDLQKFRFSQTVREMVRKQLQISDELLIGHVGRFCYQKNHDFFLEILKQIRERGLHAKLLLVGEGPNEKAFREKVHACGLDSYVIYYGVSKKVHELFMAMDLFALPSHFEGLPIVGVEAQASGLPVIFSDTITREAKITQAVSYLGIDARDVSKWLDTIIHYGKEKRDRIKAYDILKNAKFDIVDTVNGFISRVCDFFCVFRKFDLRYEIFIVLIFDGCQFVDTAECRTVFGGDQVRADTPGIDCGALGFQAVDQVFIQVTGSGDDRIAESSSFQHLVSFL